MRAAFLTEDLAPWENQVLPGGCAYYRQLLPRNAIPGAAFGKPAWSGITGFGVQLGDGTAQFGFDVVFFKMIMARWIPEQMRIAQQLGQKIVVDVDDSYDDLHPANQAYHTTDPEKNKIFNRDINREVIMQADLVTVSTPYLYDYYSGMRDNVVMVRNGVNPKQFPHIPTRKRKPIIGWVGATKWRSNDVEEARPWLADWLEEHDCMFLHAGYMNTAPSFAQAAGVPEERLMVTAMLPITMYHNLFKEIDIGLVLLSDIPFNHAKSNIKGLEYALTGIPFVAQDLPEYKRLADMGVGRVAHTPDDWKRHLTELLDYRTRKREALANRNMTLKDHTIQQRLPEWRDVFARFEDNRLDLQTMVVPYEFAR